MQVIAPLSVSGYSGLSCFRRRSHEWDCCPGSSTITGRTHQRRVEALPPQLGFGGSARFCASSVAVISRFFGAVCARRCYVKDFTLSYGTCIEV